MQLPPDAFNNDFSSVIRSNVCERIAAVDNEAKVLAVFFQIFIGAQIWSLS